MTEMMEVVDRFLETKNQMDKLKKSVDADNKLIKEYMLKNNLSELEGGVATAKVSISERVSFIEDALLSKLRNIDAPLRRGIIRKREFVDMDALENAIYNGKIDPLTIEGCREVKEIVTLRIAERK